jgi:SP family myo-inositol transporter-like MFS transporter 13
VTVCLVVAAVSFAYIPIDLHTLEVQSDNIGWPGMLLIAVIILFVGFYSSGVATVAWIGSKSNPSTPIPQRSTILTRDS